LAEWAKFRESHRGATETGFKGNVGYWWLLGSTQNLISTPHTLLANSQNHELLDPRSLPGYTYIGSKPRVGVSEQGRIEKRFPWPCSLSLIIISYLPTDIGKNRILRKLFEQWEHEQDKKKIFNFEVQERVERNM
jgi:hypothetical protein